MAKKRRSALATRIDEKSQAFTTAELNSLLFVTVASLNGWTHKLNPANGQALAQRAFPCLPPMTLFGLSRPELDAVKMMLQSACYPRRQFKAWISIKNYRVDKWASDGMITILNPGRFHASESNKAEVSGCTGRSSGISSAPDNGTSTSGVRLDTVPVQTHRELERPHQGTLGF